MLNIPYVMKKVLIDKNSISKFYINESQRRDLRQGKIKSLVHDLEQGQHFSSPWVANETDKKSEIIDANHRYEAVKEVISRNRNFSIYVWVATYNNLTREQIREIYKIWNIGTPQSSSDFLKAYFPTIPKGQDMLNRLNLSIYGDKTKLGVKAVVGSHINAKKQNRFEGGYSSGKEKIVADFRAIDDDDLDTIEDFLDFMKECFGVYYPKHIFYRTTSIGAFYRIWYDNKDRYSQDRIVASFKKVFTKYPDQWDKITSAGGRGATINFYEIAIRTLNKGKSMNFLSDTDTLKKKEEEEEEKDRVLEIVKLVKKK